MSHVYKQERACSTELSCFFIKGQGYGIATTVFLGTRNIYVGFRWIIYTGIIKPYVNKISLDSIAFMEARIDKLTRSLRTLKRLPFVIWPQL